MNAEQKKAKVRDVVIEHFLQTHECLSAEEVAEVVGWSTSTARKWLIEAEGIFASDEWRTSYSRDYPGMETGAHMVKVYSPGRQVLASMVLNLRARLQFAIGDGVEKEPPCTVCGDRPCGCD